MTRSGKWRRPAVLDPLPSFVGRPPRPTRFPHMSKCESLIAVNRSFLWKIRAASSGHEISSPFEGELESLKRLCVIEYRVKAAVIVMVFCVFVRPSLRRVIKYSDLLSIEISIWLGLEKFEVLKDGRVLDRKWKINSVGNIGD